MRKYLLFFALIMFGCDGSTGGEDGAILSVLQTDPQIRDWMLRLSGKPYVLNDVIWDGSAFVAVGDGGAVLTSADGITWVERGTPTDASLLSVEFHGADILAVGTDGTVLLSSDHGASWTVKHGDQPWITLRAVVANDELIVAGGFNGALAADLVLISADGGDSWDNPLPFGGGTGYWFTDLVYEDGLYIATASDAFAYNKCQGDSIGDAKVQVSDDGKVWNPIVLRDEPASFNAILHDGSRFIAVGNDSTVFASFDGYNWTEFGTPVADVDYLSVARDGPRLVAAGRTSECYWLNGETPQFARPTGITSDDDGLTWELFNIGGDYESRGMAWGKGRFVSVGQTSPVSGEGAIYSTD